MLVEVELDDDDVAEFHQADLCVARTDHEGLDDVGGEADHVHEPVVVVVGHDARRLIQHQNNVRHLTASLAAFYRIIVVNSRLRLWCIA